MLSRASTCLFFMLTVTVEGLMNLQATKDGYYYDRCLVIWSED